MTVLSETPTIFPSAADGLMRPLAARERVAAVDILRGLAIFGILPINVYYFSHPWFLDFGSFLEAVNAGTPAKPLDRIVHAIVFFLSNDMLYSLFAFLFAFGMATLMARTEACGASFVRLYVRRLLVLLGFGICHVVFFWAGDILCTYALLGFLLLAFRNRADSTLVAWAALCLSIGVIGYAVLLGFAQVASAAPPAAAAVQPSPEASPADSLSGSRAPTTDATSKPAEPAMGSVMLKWAAKMNDIYSRGTYGKILIWRLVDYVFWTGMAIFMEYPRVLGMFLLGLWAGRRRILLDIPANLPFIRKVAVRGLVVGIAASLAAFAANRQSGEDALPSPWSALIAFAGDAVRIPSLCLAGAALVILLVQYNPWRRWLGPLAAVGRMSLTNYLLQSVVCSLIFYGYGLGLYGKVGPTACLLLAVVIFLPQIPLSVLWLRHMRFGPAEWLWRTLTYGQVQPMRLSGSTA